MQSHLYDVAVTGLQFPFVLQVLLKQGSLLTSHVAPSNKVRQLHAKVPFVLTHVPLFLQGFDSHGLTCLSQLPPVNPAGQLHFMKPSSFWLQFPWVRQGLNVHRLNNSQVAPVHWLLQLQAKFVWLTVPLFVVFVGVYEIDTQKNGIFTQTLYFFFEAVNYHTKKNKITEQSAFHTDLVNWHTKK